MEMAVKCCAIGMTTALDHSPSPLALSAVPVEETTVDSLWSMEVQDVKGVP